MKTVVGVNDSYVNIFLSRGFKQKRSAYGLKFFEHKASGVFVTYDPAGIQTRVIITTDKSGNESLYEGDSMREVQATLSNQGLEIVRELVWD